MFVTDIAEVARLFATKTIVKEYNEAHNDVAEPDGFEFRFFPNYIPAIYFQVIQVREMEVSEI